MIQNVLKSKSTKDNWKELMHAIQEAQKDTTFRKEVRQFIRITTS